jgi:hypothetical protein
MRSSFLAVLVTVIVWFGIQQPAAAQTCAQRQNASTLSVQEAIVRKLQGIQRAQKIERRLPRRLRRVCTWGTFWDRPYGIFCRSRFCGYVRNGRPVNGYFRGRGCIGERITCYGNIIHAVCR